MAHNVKMSDLINGIVLEAKLSFLAEVVSSLQVMASDLQTVGQKPIIYEPINRPTVEPKQHKGFSVQVAAVGARHQFRAFADCFDVDLGESNSFFYKGYIFELISTQMDSYPMCQRVLFIGEGFLPVGIKIVGEILSEHKESSMMTPMELIELYNRL